jgi:hypothetical protein
MRAFSSTEDKTGVDETPHVSRMSAAS